jgi:hypothetical protein
MFEKLSKLHLKKVNPFQGLVIDADTWHDAHNYHVNQHKLHLMVFHKTGIIEGLRVVGNHPPDFNVSIEPGVAVDSEGNTIVVTQTQNYQIQTRKKKTIYLIIQFREIPTEPYQPPEGGQATRIIDGYRIREVEQLPDESYLELARIDIDPSENSITNPENPSRPGKNEINSENRQEVLTPADSAPSMQQVASQSNVSYPTAPSEVIMIGSKVLGDAGEQLHLSGLRNLLSEVAQRSLYKVDIKGNIPLNEPIIGYTLICLFGADKFELSEIERESLDNFLRSGGTILGEFCSEGQYKKGKKLNNNFKVAFDNLAKHLGCNLEPVQRGHSILSRPNLFSSTPEGAAANSVLLAGGGMLYSGNDYACAWQGGYQDAPLSREVIRSSLEIGINIIEYAIQNMKQHRK